MLISDRHICNKYLIQASSIEIRFLKEWLVSSDLLSCCWELGILLSVQSNVCYTTSSEILGFLAYSLRNVTLHFKTKALARDRAIVLSSDCPSSMTTAFQRLSFVFLFHPPIPLFDTLRERRPKYLWIISSSLASFVDSTMAPHNERRRNVSQRLNSTMGQYYDYMVN